MKSTQGFDLEVFDEIERRAERLARALVSRLPPVEGPGARRRRGARLGGARLLAHHLSFAVARGRPEALGAFLHWMRAAAPGLALDPAELEAVAGGLADATARCLPPARIAAATALVEAALACPAPAPRPPLDPAAPLHELACAFLEDLLDGQGQLARARVQAAVALGTPVAQIYRRVIAPVLHEVGERWQRGRMTVTQEHYCTAAARMAMAGLFAHLHGAPKAEASVVVALVNDERHELAGQMVADAFTLAGWDAYLLGADTPAGSVVEAVVSQRPDALALPVTLAPHVRGLARVVTAVRALPHPPVVVVGGRPFEEDPGLAEAVGADVFAADPAEAVARTAARVRERRARQAPETRFSAALCTSSGLILEVLRDDFGLWPRNGHPGRFGERLAADEAGRAADFLAALPETGFAARDLHWPPGGDGRRLRVVGGRAGSLALVVVGRAGERIEDVYRRLRPVAAEQAALFATIGATPRNGLLRAEPLLGEVERLEAELAALRHELWREGEHRRLVERERSDLAEAVGREIRAALFAITGWGDVLRDGEARPDRRHALDRIDALAEAVGRTMVQLADFVAIQAGDVRPRIRRFDLVQAIHGPIERVRRRAEGKSVAIDPGLPAFPVLVDGDPDQLGRVVAELLDNAVKYSRPGGRVRVTVAEVDGEVRTAVQDDGVGVPPALRARLFHGYDPRHVRGTAGERGAGLALMICARIVERHGGRWSVDTRAGAGSTFSFVLPRPQA
jgi:signal transduction histidine kinase/methanogenic corrinoid protein MtbC1